MSSLTQTESATPGPVHCAGPLKIGLVQINNSFSGQNYLPYSIALLQTYVQKFAVDPSLYEFLTPLYKRVRISDAVEALKDADLVGFSTYVWNGRISLEIARRLKDLKPGIVIVFGGPHVPDQPEAFLRANRQVDLAARYRHIEQAEQILMTEAPIIPIYYAVNMDWCKDYVTNFFHPRMTTVWKGMRVDKAARDRAR